MSGGLGLVLRPKVYLDTSVISHLLADDAPEKREDTHKLWNQLKENEYEVIVSPVIYEELSRCEENLRDSLIDFLNDIETTYVEETDHMLFLAKEYIASRVLPPKSLNDCRHIAIASISGCKYILSWNMKHFVKLKTIEMVQTINGKLGVFQPIILTPSIFIRGDDDDDL